MCFILHYNGRHIVLPSWSIISDTRINQGLGWGMHLWFGLCQIALLGDLCSLQQCVQVPSAPQPWHFVRSVSEKLHLNVFLSSISLADEIEHSFICVWAIWYSYLWIICYVWVCLVYSSISFFFFSSSISVLLPCKGDWPFALGIANTLNWFAVCGFLQCRYFKSACCWVCQYFPLWLLGFDS